MNVEVTENALPNIQVALLRLRFRPIGGVIKHLKFCMDQRVALQFTVKPRGA